jgi:alpha-1,6-mannosyltransferase
MSAARTRRRSGNPAKPPTPIYRPTVWHRNHRFALAGIIGATVLTLLAGVLGPSAVTLTLGPRTSYLPPWYLPAGHVHPNEWLVSIMIWSAIIIGAVGLWIGLRALDDGWKPKIKRLFGLGAALSLVTITVPPMTSADVLMYAAYGRLQTIGMDPYEITPAEVFRSQFDPVLRWTERPWTDTPSVYGPITSWTQLLANKLGGENMHDIVFWLQVFSVVPFILACIGAVMLTRGDARRQGRAVLLTIANPMLIWAVVAGAHNEALSVMFAVAGMMFMRKNPFLAGIGIGLAGCAKVSIGIWGLGMLWAYRREPKKAALLCLGTVIPMGLAYVVWQPAAFLQAALHNGGYVSVGSWANPVYRFLDVFMTSVHAKVVVGVISYTGLVVIAWMLSRTLPWSAAPGLPREADPRQDPLTIALRTALVLSVAWLITSMYTLSWYDLIAWLPLAVLAASKLDRIMLMRIAPLSLAYVPGRAIDVGPALDFTASRIRDTISPIVQFAVLLAVIMWWRKPEREELFPFRREARPARQPLPVLAAARTGQAKAGNGRTHGDSSGPIGQPMPTGRSRTPRREVSGRVSPRPSGGQQSRHRPRSR